jgi:hypothetical protein
LYASGSGARIYLHDSDIKKTTSSYAAMQVDNSGEIEAWLPFFHYFDGKNTVKGGRVLATGNGGVQFGTAAGSHGYANNHFCNDGSTVNPWLEVSSGGTIYAKYDYWPNGATPG